MKFIGFERLTAGESLRLERKGWGLLEEKRYSQDAIGILKSIEFIEVHGIEHMKEQTKNVIEAAVQSCISRRNVQETRVCTVPKRCRRLNKRIIRNGNMDTRSAKASCPGSLDVAGRDAVVSVRTGYYDGVDAMASRSLG